jgi:hypothetical protein
MMLKPLQKVQCSLDNPVLGEEEGNDYRVDVAMTPGDGKTPNTSEALRGAPFKVISIDGGPDKSLLNPTVIANTTAAINRTYIEKQLNDKEYTRVKHYCDLDT